MYVEAVLITRTRPFQRTEQHSQQTACKEDLSSLAEVENKMKTFLCLAINAFQMSHALMQGADFFTLHCAYVHQAAAHQKVNSIKGNHKVVF